MMSDNREAILRACLTWLYETEQPEGAIVTQHGVCRRYGDRVYSATASGWDGRPVIVIDLASWSLGEVGKWRGFEGVFTQNSIPRAGRATPQVPPCQEIQEAAEIIGSLGAEVAKMWNGAPWNTTGSIGLTALAHPSLLAAQRRYHAGCPEHNSTICGVAGCHQPWYGAGDELLVLPEWPALEAADAH